MSESKAKRFFGSLLLLTGRLAVTVVATAFLFALLPLASHFFGKEQKRESEEQKVHTVIMQMNVEKPKPKKVEPKKMRQVNSTITGKSSSRSLDMKFTPDLGVGGGDGVAVAAGGSAEMIFEEGETDEPPIAVKRSPIAYPRAAKNAGIEGVIEVVFVIDREGNVTDIDFTKLPHKVFRRPIEETIKKWKYKPARMKGVPVSIRARQSITFKLDR